MTNLNIDEYDYGLPDERIAKFPLDKRDDAKLLVYKNDCITDTNFRNITEYLPPESLLIFNNTKVIKARIIFTKDTGAEIEIFCLEPASNHPDINAALMTKGYSRWNCLIGNSKRWKSGMLKKDLSVNGKEYALSIEKSGQNSGETIIDFHWTAGDIDFSKILELAGQTPLPPYIKRKPIESDILQYQTIYAEKQGSVAAPTAGFHFTDNVLNKLNESGLKTDNITLHIGAGTFKPVTAKSVLKHKMHKEVFIINKSTVHNLLNQKKPIIAVGTTSVRTLESIYWLGVKLMTDKLFKPEISQWDAYKKKYNKNISVSDALRALNSFMANKSIDNLTGSTSLIIVPGYKFQIISGMITNFHQPKSTLLLLVSAFTGENWKKVYKHAMDNNYRFLSYGDCCLFL